MAKQIRKSGGLRVSHWRMAGWVGAVLILLVPLVAMQFTDEVMWTPLDFVFAGVLLFGSLGTYELAARRTKDAAYRAGVGVALLAAFLLVWVNGAVGLIGGADNDANLMYGGVLAVGLGGAFVARFQPQGMARALLATAVAQVLAAAIAVIGGLGNTGPIWAIDLLVLTGVFTVLWVGSAALFWYAARETPPARARSTSDLATDG